VKTKTQIDFWLIENQKQAILKKKLITNKALANTSLEHGLNQKMYDLHLIENFQKLQEGIRSISISPRINITEVERTSTPFSTHLH